MSDGAGMFCGQVTGSVLPPMEGVVVVARKEGSDDELARARTDAAGRYAVSGLESGARISLSFDPSEPLGGGKQYAAGHRVSASSARPSCENQKSAPAARWLPLADASWC
jgi:hypothetical protein